MIDENKPADGGAAGLRIAGWMHEDELPEGYPYDAMFPHSKVDGVRMFPVFAPAAAKADEGGAVDFDSVCDAIRQYGEKCIAIGRETVLAVATRASALAADVIALAREREDGYRNREYGNIVNGRVADKLVELARRIAGKGE